MDNGMILSNLHRIDKSGGTIIIRCPVIPGYNDRTDHLESVAKLANSLQHFKKMEIIPYHPLGQKKYEWLGRIYPLKNLKIPDQASSLSDLSKI